jgi:hypothetical protein
MFKAVLLFQALGEKRPDGLATTSLHSGEGPRTLRKQY